MDANCALVIAASIQALATVVLVLVTGRYAKKTRDMAQTMKESYEAQKRQFKIKADIVTALFQWAGEKSLRKIAGETGHTEDDIKTVIPDLMAPNGPIVFLGFRKDEPIFRASAQWDPLGPAQKQKVRADVVSFLLEGGEKTVGEIATKTGQSEETIKNFLPDLLDPSGPIICSIGDGGVHFRVRTAGPLKMEKGN